MRPLLSLTAIMLTCGAALAREQPFLTHVEAQSWQSTDFHDQQNPGCSIGGAGSVPGSRLIMGVNVVHPDPAMLVIRRTGWDLNTGATIRLQASFSDGSSFNMAGTAKKNTINIDVSRDALPAWIHALTANSVMQMTFNFPEPRWSFDLAGTSTVVNAMARCVQDHQITSVAYPLGPQPPPEPTVIPAPEPAPQASATPLASIASPPPPPAATPPAVPAAAIALAPNSQTDDHVLVKWSGNLPMQTRPFHVDGAWEVQWTAGEGYFALILHHANGDGKDLLTNGSTPGSSSFYEPRGGDFYLQVDASSEWSVRAVAVVPPAASVAAVAPPPVPQPPAVVAMPASAAPALTTPLAPATQAPAAPIVMASTPPTTVPTGALAPDAIVSASPTAVNNGPPQSEATLIAAVKAARAQYDIGQNDMAKGAARPARAQAICQSSPSTNAEGWVGKISRLTTNGDGKGVVAIEIAPDTLVTTWNNALSDVADGTLIDPNSPMFKRVSAMQTGQAVRFSGTLVRSDVDCFRESSMTLAGSISEPEYIMRFQSIDAVQ